GWLSLALKGLRARAERAELPTTDLHEAENLLGNLEWMRGDFSAVAAARERAAAVARSQPLLGSEVARADIIAAAVALMAGGRLDDARARLTRELAVTSDEALRSTRAGVLLRGQLGAVYRAEGRLGEAAALLREAI